MAKSCVAVATLGTAKQRHGTDQHRVGWAPTGNASATLGGAKPGHSDEAQRLGTALPAMLGSGYAQRRKAKEQLGKSTLWQCKVRRGSGRA